MTTHLVAIALTAALFAWFVAFHRRGCDGTSCGTGTSCGSCSPTDSPPTDHAEDHHHA